MRLSALQTWEDRLRKVASSAVYPETPDLWPSLRPRLASTESIPARARLRRVAVLAALALALVGGLLTAPKARAAIFRVLRIGVVRVFFEPVTPIPGPVTPLPMATPGPTPVLRPPLDLRGLMTLTEAEEALGFPLPLPAYPPGLGKPDLVFSQSVEGPLAILVWLDAQDPSKARLALHVLGPETFAGKSESRVVQETDVGGNDALWLEGSHFLLLRNGSMALRSLVTGNVLLWSEGDLTYRLETDRPLEEAVRIAESLP